MPAEAIIPRAATRAQPPTQQQRQRREVTHPARARDNPDSYDITPPHTISDEMKRNNAGGGGGHRNSKRARGGNGPSDRKRHTAGGGRRRLGRKGRGHRRANGEGVWKKTIRENAKFTAYYKAQALVPESEPVIMISAAHYSLAART